MNEEEIKRQLAMRLREQQLAENLQSQEQPAQFKKFGASELYCPKCKRAMPVREKMLLVLSRGELFDYVCVKCGTSLGTRNSAA